MHGLMQTGVTPGAGQHAPHNNNSSPGKFAFFKLCIGE
jgi:hypothetical protein